MKISVLGGSPKGEKSVTMQYVEYMRRRRPDVEFEIHQPALRIRRLEQDEDAFDTIIDSVHSSDMVLWAFPLYVHGVCSQYQRFIELIGERDAQAAFRGTPAAVLCTSIKFFDHTAVDFIRATSEDLGMPWVGSHSAHMRDLNQRDGRQAMDGFITGLIQTLKHEVPLNRQFPVIIDKVTDSPTCRPASAAPTGHHTGKRIVVVCDSDEGKLRAMVERFSASFSDEVRLVDLSRIRIAGGCLGCLKCGPANHCAWDGSDDVRRIYEEEIEKADLYVIATRVRGRWHSALMKSFIDRGFFHTHQPFLTGKKTIVLLEGSLAGSPPLRDYLHAYMDWQGADLQGIAASLDCDDSPVVSDPSDIDSVIDALAATAVTALENDIRKPRSFPGIAGMMIFRDEIFSHLRMVFRADHKMFRKTGVYRTMIQKRPLRLLLFRLIGAITSIPPIQKKMIGGMREFMIMPFKSVIEHVMPMDQRAESEVMRSAGKDEAAGPAA